MAKYTGIEQVQRALTHDQRRHTLKRRAYKTLAAYERAKRQDGKK